MERFYLYLYGSDGMVAEKKEYQGAEALVNAAKEAQFEYPEIRGTDLMDLLVLHIVDGKLLHPAA